MKKITKHGALYIIRVYTFLKHRPIKIYKTVSLKQNKNGMDSACPFCHKHSDKIYQEQITRLLEWGCR